jgi:hypothetical protein
MNNKYPKPKIGDVFGRWTVIELGRKCLCRCSCGREFHVKKASLTTGVSTKCKSCRSQINGFRNRKHFYPQGTTIRMVRQVQAAVQRCTNPNCPQWQDYGGRGIVVCKEWIEDQAKFVSYLMTLDGWDDNRLYIDRIDNDGGYFPGNIRFVTPRESLLNRRKYKPRKVS